MEKGEVQGHERIRVCYEALTLIRINVVKGGGVSPQIPAERSGAAVLRELLEGLR